TRSPALPDVPTYGELGLPQMGGGGWFGVVAPAGTPPAVVAKLNAAIHKAMQHPDFVRKMDESGARLIPGTPEQFAKDIEQAVARYDRVSKLATVRIDGGAMPAECRPFAPRAPAAPAVPRVCDSPHSGTAYPADYGHAVPRALLRRGEDTHVEALWEAVPAVG